MINSMMSPASALLAPPSATPPGAAVLAPPLATPPGADRMLASYLSGAAGRSPDPAASTAAAGPNSLTEFARVMSGDLSGSLSSGDKLLALSGLLRSVTRSGRRAGLTPQQVIGDLQRRKIAEIQGRMQLETMQREREQQQQRAAVLQQFTANMGPDQAARFTYLLSPDQQSEVVKQEFINRELAAAGLVPGTPKFAEGQRRLSATGSVIRGPDGSLSFMPGTNLNDLISGAPPAAALPADAGAVLNQASRDGRMDYDDYQQLRGRLGENGRASMDDYLSQNNILVTGQSGDGNTYYYVNGDWYDNPEGRE